MKLVNIQGRVPEEYFKVVRAMMDQRKLNWNQVLTLCLRDMIQNEDILNRINDEYHLKCT